MGAGTSPGDGESVRARPEAGLLRESRKSLEEVAEDPSGIARRQGVKLDDAKAAATIACGVDHEGGRAAGKMTCAPPAPGTASAPRQVTAPRVDGALPAPPGRASRRPAPLASPGAPA